VSPIPDKRITAENKAPQPLLSVPIEVLVIIIDTNIERLLSLRNLITMAMEAQLNLLLTHLPSIEPHLNIKHSLHVRQLAYRICYIDKFSQTY
jgi:hypothetical protein